MKIMGHECSPEEAEWFVSPDQTPTHANEYPHRAFVPWVGSMAVETTPLETHFDPNREDVAGISLEERETTESTQEGVQ